MIGHQRTSLRTSKQDDERRWCSRSCALDGVRDVLGDSVAAHSRIRFVGSRALLIEFLFELLGLIPSQRSAQIVETSISFNYRTVLNIIFLAIAALLLIRFFQNRRAEDAGAHGVNRFAFRIESDRAILFSSQ